MAGKERKHKLGARRGGKIGRRESRKKMSGNERKKNRSKNRPILTSTICFEPLINNLA